jgi:hypothetical protein
MIVLFQSLPVLKNCLINQEPTMRRSSTKLSNSHCLASAGLALLLLGVSIPRLAAYQSDDFNNQSDANWARYSLPATNPYGVAVFSFPTNPASAGNYALRMYVPPIVNDSNNPPSLVPRGGVIWTNGDSVYGGLYQDPGFYVAADLIAWNPAWSDSLCGVAWYVQGASFLQTSAYVSGWGPGSATIGIAKLDISADPPYEILGMVEDGTTVLKTNHQYRMVSFSPNGYRFVVQIFDRSQTNTAWQTAISEDFALYGTAGNCALMVANSGICFPWQTPGNTTQGGDATFDNYFAYRPIPDQNPAQLPAMVSDTYPPPASQPSDYRPTVKVCILNMETDVRTNTIQFYMDGALLTSGVNITSGVVKTLYDHDPITWEGATVTYSNGVVYADGSWHTNKVVFQDNQSIYHTNSWWWQTATPSISLYASNSLPIGSLSQRGFDARLVESLSTSSDPAIYTNYANINANAANSAWFTVLQDGLSSAFAVLSYQYQVSYSATNIVQLVDFNRYTDTINGIAVTNFPGLCLPAGDAHVNSYAVDVQAYLQLSAGVHRFHVNSDDAVGIYSGTNPNDTSAVLYSYNSVANADFDFYVPTDGLYPIRIVMEEGMGGAYLNLYSVDLQTGAKSVVNADNSDVKAFYPLVCRSATSVKPGSTWTVVNATNVVTTIGSFCEGGSGGISNFTVTGGTNTVALPGSAMYYRLDGPRKTTIRGLTKSGSTLLIPYLY